MAVFIDSIKFSNYRQYKDVYINFEKTSSNLYPLIAPNGTGKTTLLNGISWCLYKTEPHLTDETKSLPIVNSKLLDESSENSKVNVRITMELHEGDDNIYISRTVDYGVICDKNGLKSVIDLGKEKELTVKINRNIDKENTIIYYDEIAEEYIEKIFDHNISHFYFFDGENLDSYFTKNSSDKIKQSIFSISQVTLLINTMKHVETLCKEKFAKMSKDIPDLKDLKAKKDDVEADLQESKRSIVNYQLKIDKLDSRIQEIKKIFISLGPISQKQERRNYLENKLKEKKNSLKTLKEDKKQLLINYYYYLNVYQSAQNILEFIIQKEKEGKFPQYVDRDRIQKILNDNRCDVCKRPLDAGAREELNRLFDEISITGKTTQFLTQFKSTFEHITETAPKYRDELDRLNISISRITFEIGNIEDELNKISNFLENYDMSSEDIKEKIDVSKLENELKLKQAEYDNYKTQVMLLENNITQKTSELSNIENQISEINKNIESSYNYKKEYELLNKCYNYMDTIKNNITNNIKTTIEYETWKIFNEVIWKNHSFKNVEINDEYILSVIDRFDNDCIGSLSAAEQMTLAYAFTFAVHKASGKNCPVIIDSPLGRSSGENRKNLVRTFVKISKEKQIILLLNEDECNQEIREILIENEIALRQLNLTIDESEVTLRSM